MIIFLRVSNSNLICKERNPHHFQVASDHHSLNQPVHIKKMYLYVYVNIFPVYRLYGHSQLQRTPKGTWKTEVEEFSRLKIAWVNYHLRKEYEVIDREAFR